MKAYTWFTVLAAFAVSPLIADETSAPSEGPSFTDEQKAAFKAERAKIAKGKKAMWAEAFRYRDKDADGILTFEEANAHHIKHAKKHNEEPGDIRPDFDAWDTNKDGVVLMEEMEANFATWLVEKRAAHDKKKEAKVQAGEEKKSEP